MKNEKGFSLIVLVTTIIVIIIIAAISLNSSNDVIDEATDSKIKAEAKIDDDKIDEIITYEVAGTKELIDPDIDFERIELNDSLKIEYDGSVYRKWLGALFYKC